MDPRSRSSDKPSPLTPAGSAAKTVKRVLGRTREPAFGLHPGLIPDIDVEDTGLEFPTRRSVFVVALLVAVSVIAWAFISPSHINAIGTTMQTWVVTHFGWLFSAVVVATVVFMLIVGYGPT